LLTSPAFLAVMVEHHRAAQGASPMGSLRTCVSSTEPLSAALRERVALAFGIEVLEQYGCTEAGSVTLQQPGQTGEGHLGLPLPSVQIGAFSETGRPLPQGEVGRLGVSGAGVAMGYLLDPERQARYFRDGWVFPGDRASLSPEGHLHLYGRDDLFSVGGLKVDPDEVVAALRGYPGVEEAAVFAVENAEGTEIHAVVTTTAPDFDQAACLRHCRGQLSAHKLPRFLRVVEELPRDANGKPVLPR